MSQVTCIGAPDPQTWDEYEQGCIGTYGGGYRTPTETEIFHHGMATVFNLLRAEFPAAVLCKAAPELLRACKLAQGAMGAHGPCNNNSCRECGVVWKRLGESIAKGEEGP